MIDSIFKKDVVALADQEARDLFVCEVSKNFSVIAPAGVGKTTAVVARIVHYIESKSEVRGRPNKVDLVVVTYTQKAAQEMEKRVKAALEEKAALNRHRIALKQIFFGTIHSFCLYLIREYGNYLGLPVNLKLSLDDEVLWQEFIAKQDNVLGCLNSDAAAVFKKYLNINDVIGLSRKIGVIETSSDELEDPPFLSFGHIFDYKAENRNAESVDLIKKELEAWLDACNSTVECVGLPECSSGGKEFKEIWANTFYPLWNWLGKAILCVCQSLSKSFFEYRLNRGFISYDDMVLLALRILRDETAGDIIRREEMKILLDEAQDTDSNQFELFLEITRSSRDCEVFVPREGHFSMVGDPQQAIYSGRADLPTYLNLHKRLTDTGQMGALIFMVTMRCDYTIVEFVNQVFPSVLQKTQNALQVGFVPLQARPWAGRGNVIRLCLKVQQDEGNKERYEACFVVEWLVGKGREGLGISQWGDLAILCPRKSWLNVLGEEFKRQGVPFQVSSQDKVLGDCPAYAWLTGLTAVAVDPFDSFEIAGVLREIYGVSDHEIAIFVREHEWNNKKEVHPLNIFYEAKVGGIVGEILTELRTVYFQAQNLSLRDALSFWVDKCLLRDRLRLLPHAEGELLGRLDHLLFRATVEEEKGSSLYEFFQMLKADYYSMKGDETFIPDAVQLYTCHKSKGLQWKVVVMPFFFRPILYASEPYPQFFSQDANGNVKVAVAAHPAKKEYDAFQAYLREKELERLFYVSVTRSKNSLIMIDDRCLYKNYKNSFGALAGMEPGGKNYNLWSSLKDEPLVYEVSERSTKPDLGSDFLDTLDLDDKKIEDGIENSKGYIKRFLPSELKNKESVVVVEKSEIRVDSSSSMEYGVWWHETFSGFSWREGKEELQCYIEKRVGVCPLTERGREELNLFLETEIAGNLCSGKLTVQTEVPFLWKSGNDACFEGFIDLLAYNPEKREAFVLDWKTDSISVGSEHRLLELYGSQVSIYMSAVTGIYNINCRAFIYSTCLGRIIEVS